MFIQENDPPLLLQARTTKPLMVPCFSFPSVLDSSVFENESLLKFHFSRKAASEMLHKILIVHVFSFALDGETFF